MDLQLTGKRVLITAGHKGIGYRIAYRMLEEGAIVAICCRQREALDSALQQLGELGTVVGEICDVSDPDQVISWVNWSAERPPRWSDGGARRVRATPSRHRRSRRPG